MLKTTYTGSCHCGKVAFEFDSERITEGIQCNCSICIRKNAIMSMQYIPPEDFRLKTDIEELSVYHWGDKDVNHYFCPTCGIYPFHDATYEPGKFRINLGCIDRFEPGNVTVTQFDGKRKL